MKSWPKRPPVVNARQTMMELAASNPSTDEAKTLDVAIAASGILAILFDNKSQQIRPQKSVQ
jgi:hypothetical protein